MRYESRVDYLRRAPYEHPAAAAGPDTAATTDRTTPTGDAEARRDRDDPGMLASDDVRESEPRASPTRRSRLKSGRQLRSG